MSTKQLVGAGERAGAHGGRGISLFPWFLLHYLSSDRAAEAKCRYDAEPIYASDDG